VLPLLLEVYLVVMIVVLVLVLQTLTLVVLLLLVLLLLVQDHLVMREILEVKYYRGVIMVVIVVMDIKL
jgi:hypothetical protein